MADDKALPDEIMLRLQFFCEANGLGLAQISGPDFCIILMGNSEWSPDEAAIMAAHVLLGGVLIGEWRDDNAIAVRAALRLAQAIKGKEN